MITDNLSGVVCGNSDVLLDQLIEDGVHFDLILTDPPYNINKDFGNKSDCLPLDEFVAVTAERMAKVKNCLNHMAALFGSAFTITLVLYKWLCIMLVCIIEE